jgi:N-acyl-D-aspartate/D-glutamate deacylase
MGNCGLALAPVRPGGEDALVSSFVRVEAIPRAALEQGVRWGWRSYGDYLDGLEGKIGLNVGGLVGHIALRHAALGEEAVERAAIPAEIEQMQTLVREAMLGGALGMSTNRNERHFREDLKPIASRLADDDELFALGDVLAELNAGVIQTILGLNRLEHLEWYGGFARRTGRPITWQTINHAWSEPDLWRKQLDGIGPTFKAGYRAYALSNAAPITRRFSLKNVQVFDEFPLWKNVMFLPEPVRVQALSDPDTRQKLRADMAAPEKTTFHRRWDLVHIVSTARPEHAQLNGKSVAEMAAAQDKDPLDAFFDLALAENLETMFVTSFTGGDHEAVGQILQSPYTLVGVSDAGAHVQFGADFGYSTLLLGYWVRERGVLSLEQAIHKLTFQVASIYGLEGRGLLRPGYAADVAVFDPGRVRSCEPEWAQDYPANTRRLIQCSEGMHYTIVNGSVVYDDGRLSGDLPGQVLRGAVYQRAN